MSALRCDDGAAFRPGAPSAAVDRVVCIVSTVEVSRGIACRGMMIVVGRATEDETR